jgi:hypothetical protein
MSPFVMVAKCLFQELWILGLEWDEEIPQNLNGRFGSWLNDISLLKQFSIPRNLVDDTWQAAQNKVQLHAFGDA